MFYSSIQELPRLVRRLLQAINYIEYDDSCSEDSDINDRYNWINESAQYLTPVNAKREFMVYVKQNTILNMLKDEVMNSFLQLEPNRNFKSYHNEFNHLIISTIVPT